MRVRLGGISTVVVAVATATCGMLMLGGIGPTPAGAGLTGEVLPGVVPSSSSSTTTTTATTVPTGGDTTSTTTPASTASTSTTTAIAPSPSTTLPSSPTTTIDAVPPSPLPLSVSASQTVVGVGGSVDFSGTCPAPGDAAPGSLVVWVISDTTEQISTGVTAADWTYRWVAPTDPNRIASFTFQFWCGDPGGWQGGYPAELQRTVDMVAQAGPPPTPTTPLTEATPLPVIPETD